MHDRSSTANRLPTVVSSDRFQQAVLAAIVVNAVVVGFETVPSLVAEHGAVLRTLDRGLLALFVVEIALRIAAEPRRFFRDGWNVFDAAVIGLSLLPQVGSFATVARLARVLRVTRLVSALPELRLIVATMLRSIPSMGHVRV
jgi:voltage-gated sodium channel